MKTLMLAALWASTMLACVPASAAEITTLYSFAARRPSTLSGLSIDRAGSLYSGGADGVGSVFELARTNGRYAASVGGLVLAADGSL